MKTIMRGFISTGVSRVESTLMKNKECNVTKKRGKEWVGH